MKIAALALVICACQAPASPPPPADPAPAPPAAAAVPAPPAASPTPPPLPARLVAVGDLHGDLDNALAVLRLAGLVDATGRWSGGAAVLVQTGDTIDRGADSKEVLELLQRLQREAKAAGGQVIPLMGNHEAMNLLGDWRYVTPDDVAHFGGEAQRKAAFSPTSDLGRWLLGNDAVVQVGDVIFAHGGVSARFAPQGVAALARGVKLGVLGEGSKDVIGPEGPMWYRGYLLADEPLACAELDQALAALHARRMVVGHTVQESGKIAARCGGRLLGIDTGISDHYGGHLSALELLAGDAGALYAAGREDLPDP